jgi:hypothetical protein
MRIVHLQRDPVTAKPISKKDSKIERCTLLIANQTFEDKKTAEKIFAERLKNIKNKHLKLGI